jgi:hypothetical protein
MFYKIEKPFLRPMDDWSKFNSDNLHYKYESIPTSIAYYGLQEFDLFRKQHSRRPFTKNSDTVRWAEVANTGILCPHRDHGVSAVLNYYISGGEDVTVFYKPKPGCEKGLHYSGWTWGNIYLFSMVEEVARFVAKPGDAYLLDVTQIHAVFKTSPEPRQFINYVWKDTPYSEILDDIKNLDK